MTDREVVIDYLNPVSGITSYPAWGPGERGPVNEVEATVTDVGKVSRRLGSGRRQMPRHSTLHRGESALEIQVSQQRPNAVGTEGTERMRAFW